MRHYSILFLAILLFSTCKSENHEPDCNYHSIVDNDMVWYISETPNPCPDCIWPHKIMFGKDTIINSFKYKEILDFRGELSETDAKPTSFGYMRETKEKKVYWYVSLFGHPAVDILVYDFNAQLNDTIENYWVVTNVDKVNMAGVERKRITVKSCASEENYWIEGVGDMIDLLSYPSRPVCGFESDIIGETTGSSWYRLNCVFKGSTLLYKNTDSSDCWSYIGYSENNKN